MRRLRFPGKMALISVAFLLPLVWLMVGFVSGAKGNIHSVAEERIGVRYAQAVYRTLDAADTWRFATRSQAYGDPGMQVDAVRKVFDDRLAELRRLQAESASHWDVAKLVNQRSYRAAEEALAPHTAFADATSEVLLVLSTVKRLGF